MPAPELVIVGRLRNAHGVRGDVVVQPITDTPAEVFTAGRRLFAGTVDGDPDPAGRALVVEDVRPFKGGFIVRFDVISDRTAAELWRDRYLLAPASELTPPDEGEIYVHELVGMHVLLTSGEPLGEVAQVYELPLGLALAVRRPEGTSVVLPFQENVVRTVDRARRQLVVEPPEGLLD